MVFRNEIFRFDVIHEHIVVLRNPYHLKPLPEEILSDYSEFGRKNAFVSSLLMTITIAHSLI